MAFAELSAAMFPTVFALFGEPVTVRLGDESAETLVTGIFRAEAESVDLSTGVPVSTVQPLLEIRELELPQGVDEDDHVTVRGQTYRVVDVRPDGHGTLKLFLHKARPFPVEPEEGESEDDEPEDAGNAPKL